MAAENIAIIAGWFEWRSVAAAARAAEPSCCWSMANMAPSAGTVPLWRFDAAPCTIMLARPSVLLMGRLPMGTVGAWLWPTMPK